MSKRQSDTTEAFKTRVDAAARRLTIAALGMAPEAIGDTYAATAGELLGYLRAANPELAAQIEATRDEVLRPYYERSLDNLLRGRSC